MLKDTNRSGYWNAEEEGTEVIFPVGEGNQLYLSATRAGESKSLLSKYEFGLLDGHARMVWQLGLKEAGRHDKAPPHYGSLLAFIDGLAWEPKGIVHTRFLNAIPQEAQADFDRKSPYVAYSVGDTAITCHYITESGRFIELPMGRWDIPGGVSYQQFLASNGFPIMEREAAFIKKHKL